jgi:hypothetical protein
MVMASDVAAESIQQRMAQIRRELDQTVDDIGDQARQLQDWRYYLGRYPWLLAASAVAAGYFVVPRRPRVLHVDREALATLARQGDLVRESKPGWAASLGRAAMSHFGNLLIRSAAGYVAQRLGAPDREGRPIGPSSPQRSPSL